MNATIVDKAIDIELRAEAISDKLLKRMAKPGKLGLPELLDQRRLRYGIPDAAFRTQATFQRIFVWQIEPLVAERDAETNRGGAIIKPASVIEREKESAPRGIIISAGLAALDALRTNGMDLGHIVLFTQYTIGRTPVEVVDGTELVMHIMHAGDISGSEDLATNLKQRKVRIDFDDESKQHFITAGKRSTKKNPIYPVVPWTPKSI